MTAALLTWLIFKTLLWAAGVAVIYVVLFILVRLLVPSHDLGMGLAAWLAMSLLYLGVEFSERKVGDGQGPMIW
jgi:uncharacterized membrane protein YhdT